MENVENILEAEETFKGEEVQLVQEAEETINEDEDLSLYPDRGLMGLYGGSGSIDNLITFGELRNAFSKFSDESEAVSYGYLIIATTGNIDESKVFNEVNGIHFLKDSEGAICTVQEINKTIQDMSSYNTPENVAEVNAFLQELSPNIQLFQA